MKKKRHYLIIILVIALLNLLTFHFLRLLKIPLFLDTWATQAGIILTNVWVGTAGGILYNLINIVARGPDAWVWSLVTVWIAIVTYLLLKLKFITLKNPLELLAAGIIIALSSTILELIIFNITHTLPDHPFRSLYLLVFNATNNYNLSVFTEQFIRELIDKPIALFIAAVVADKLKNKKYFIFKASSPLLG